MNPLETVTLIGGGDRRFSARRWSERLYQRAVDEQWSVRANVDFAALGIERFHPSIRRAMIPIYTQVQLGELLTLGLVARILERAPEPWAKMLAATQVMDEARHSEFFAEVVLRLGGPGEVNPAMQAFFDELEDLASPIDLMLGSQVVLETFAKCMFEEATAVGKAIASRRIRLPGDASPNEFLATISDLVGRDESRHVAFGVLYLQECWGSLSKGQRSKLQDLGHRLSALMEAAVVAIGGDLKRVGIDHAILLERVRRIQRIQFQRIGFDT